MTRYLIDFDSTLVAAETLDVLAEIALADAPDRESRTAGILSLTEAAMAGEIGFAEALQRRLELLQPRREHLPPLIRRLGAELTASARRQAAWLSRPEVSIVSGGFEEVIGPVMAALGVPSERIHANRFVWSEAGTALGADPNSPLAQDGGKVAVARTLSPETVVMVGDGWTDLEVWTSGAATRFYAYTEVVSRPAVLARAELTAASLDEVLQQEGIRR